MAFVIAEPCIGTKDTACVAVCPVDCIHVNKNEDGFKSKYQLYIDPGACIDCGACVPECPVTAIFPADDVPAEWSDYTDKNADFFSLAEDDFKAKWGEQEQAAYAAKEAAGTLKEEAVVEA